MNERSSVPLIIESRETDLGDFTVRRTLPDRRRKCVGPFIFFDHMGPAQFPPGTGVNVASHPHIGIATITYLFEGEILHRDSLGYVQAIQPGAVNWMTAGKGIVHSEKVTPEILASGQRLHGIQAWVALPIESEEMDPGFEHYPSESIPCAKFDGGSATVVIGSGWGVESPVRTESATLYVELNLDASAEVALPGAEELAVYVVEGEAILGDVVLREGNLAVLKNETRDLVRASTSCRLMLCGGDALSGERHIWWNFVSSSRQRLERAKDDWCEGNFGEVPGEKDFLPLPTI